MIDARSAVRRARDFVTRAVRPAFTRRAAQTWSVAGILLAGGVVLIGVGAFDAAVHEPEVLALGDEVLLSTYSVSVQDVELTDSVEDQVTADPGETLLVVTVRLENLTDRVVSVGGQVERATSRLVNVDDPLLELSGIDDLDRAAIWHDVTSSRTPLLQPYVPADITLAWRVPSAALDAEGIALEVHDADPRRGRILMSSDDVFWKRGELVARIDLGIGR